jgi:hypothetical protein
MRTSIITGILIILCFASCKHKGDEKNNNKQDSSAVTQSPLEATKKYGIKSGIVTFENSLEGLPKSKKVLYFDAYGLKECEETFNADGTVKERFFSDSILLYFLVMKNQTAFKRGAAYRGVAYKFDSTGFSSVINKNRETKKLPNETIAGKTCEVYEIMESGVKTKLAGWNNICLLMESQTPTGRMITKAISLQENVAVPAEKFKIPQDFKIQ